jgi:hypothetical protein
MCDSLQGKPKELCRQWRFLRISVEQLERPLLYAGGGNQSYHLQCRKKRVFLVEANL